MQLAPQLEALVKERPFVRLRKIDVKSWDSPVARQHEIESLPQVWLYDGKERLTADRGRALALVRAQR
ncbi:MAG: hypothetical protein JNM84_14435 [Planctomycetes bacterium]|nr:hypothetical protein [Planctomycetota bacterium]